jgi:hypothetical protein
MHLDISIPFAFRNHGWLAPVSNSTHFCAALFAAPVIASRHRRGREASSARGKARMAGLNSPNRYY